MHITHHIIASKESLNYNHHQARAPEERGQPDSGMS